MTGRKDEAVAVDPARALGVVRKRVAIKDRADFSHTERQTEVARGARMNRIDGEPARLIGGLGEKEGLERHENERLAVQPTLQPGKQKFVLS